MAHCDICGTEFDPLGFQVVVPELGAGFDRIECARQARQLASAGTPPAILPLAAIAEPVPAHGGAGLPLAFDGERRPAFGTAALGLLAAATAASVFLWLRILGADPSSFSFPGSLAPSAVERRAVAAEIVAVPEAQGAPAATRPETATTSAGSTDDGVLAPPASAPAVPAAVGGGPLRIPTLSTRRSVDETPTRKSDSRATSRKAGAARLGAGKAPAHARNRVPPGRAAGHGHGQGHENGHGHGKGKKLGHSKHG
jgi:hypothetical protein